MDNNGNSNKKSKNMRIDALRGRWTMIGIAKKSTKIRGFMHYGTSGHRLELQKKSAKIRGSMHLKGGWPMIGITKRMQK